jgi:hypothetical protein
MNKKSQKALLKTSIDTLHATIRTRHLHHNSLKYLSKMLFILQNGVTSSDPIYLSALVTIASRLICKYQGHPTNNSV